jgi:hypothetical protein
MAEVGYAPGIAWSGRNILELAVWTRFCLSSTERANQFFEDAARDAISSLDIPTELLRPSGETNIRRTRELLFARAAIDGIKKPKDYTKVSDAAKTINFQHFGKRNMLFSKWTHPTALSIFGGETGTAINNLFFETARNLAEAVQADIRAFLARA